MFQTVFRRIEAYLSGVSLRPNATLTVAAWAKTIGLLVTTLCLILGAVRYLKAVDELDQRHTSMAVLMESRIRALMDGAVKKTEALGQTLRAIHPLPDDQYFYVESTLDNLWNDVPGQLLAIQQGKNQAPTLTGDLSKELANYLVALNAQGNNESTGDPYTVHGLMDTNTHSVSRTHLTVGQTELAQGVLSVLSLVQAPGTTGTQAGSVAGILKVNIDPALFIEAIDLYRVESGTDVKILYTDWQGLSKLYQGTHTPDGQGSTLAQALGVMHQFNYQNGRFTVTVEPSVESLNQHLFSWKGLALTLALSLSIGLVAWLVVAFVFQRIYLSTVNAQKNNAEELVGILSHEVRNPLYVMQALADEFSKIELGERAQALMNMQTMALETALLTLNNTLDLKKADFAALELECIPMDLDQIVRDTKEMFRVKAEQKHIYLEASILGGHCGLVLGDPLRLQQILINLLSNALKFTPEYGSVSLQVFVGKVSSSRVSVHFAVQDTGAGIDKDLIQQVTLPYVQGDRSVARRYGGTGLGLHVVHRILDLMGSRLTIRSAPDKGTRFSFAVDFQLHTSECLADSLSHGQENQGLLGVHEELQGKKIVYVDDNPLNLMITKETLNALGAEVEVFERPVMALSTLDSGSLQVDMIICDLCMPEMSGNEFMVHVRTMDLNPQPVCIGVTALTDSQLANIDITDFDHVLSKPLTADKLARIFQKNNTLEHTREPSPIF